MTNLQRIVAFTMVLFEAIILGLMSGAYAIPAMAVVIALLGNAIPASLTLSIERRVMGGLILAVFFAVKWRLYPDAARDSVILNNGIGINLAQYAILLQAALFHVRRPRYAGIAMPPLPFTMPAYGIVIMACAGDFFVRGFRASVYQWTAYGFVATAAIYFGLSGRTEPWRDWLGRLFKPRAAVAGAILAVAGTVAWVTGHFLSEYRYEIDRVLLEPFAVNFGQQSIGFSGGGRLGSVLSAKATDADKPALRVFSTPAPGYLRGRVFATYANGQWDVEGEPREITADPGMQKVANGPVPWDARVFRLGAGTEPFDTYEVWTASAYPVAFLPFGTARFATPEDKLRLLPTGEVQSNYLARYAAYVPRQAAGAIGLSADERTRYLAIPSGLDPKIILLAQQITAGCRTASEKIAVVEGYFHTNYRYQWGIQVPPGRDPLEYFLLDRPPAHCEYFATGAAILLRAAGVPARYVTGFLAAERNEPGGYWMARNRDAHAWVEAYDEAQGWATVEATPTAGVPQPHGDSGVSAWLDNLRFMLQQLRAEGFRAMARWVGRWGLMILRVFLVPILVVLGIGGLWKAWRRFSRRKRIRRAAYDEALKPILELRQRADKILARRGLQRAPAETLHGFSRRLAESQCPDAVVQAAAQWYRDYADARYGHPLDAAVRERLAHRISLLEVKK